MCLTSRASLNSEDCFEGDDKFHLIFFRGLSLWKNSSKRGRRGDNGKEKEITLGGDNALAVASTTLEIPFWMSKLPIKSDNDH